MTFEKVRDMLAEQMQINVNSITPESRLVEDLKADSANVMVLILEMETQFDIEVADDAILNLKTVQDIVDYIDNAE
ncbi:MAG: acyl carrier protein [Christensenellaceae bacterium]|nr:acyl carrier protein [Christensenellaceae bacterium]